MKKDKLRKCENNNGECPVKDVLNRLGDKWSMLAIITLHDHGTLRFKELHEYIDNISQKMLAVTLKTLEADGLLSRKVYPQIPPRVEYTLTPLGRSFVPALMGLYHWANEHMPEIKASRERYEKI